jgi:type II secretory pathway pseudopilin PulG
MLAVITIMGIAAALVIPSMGETGVLRVQAAVRTVVSDITFAQCDAVAFQERRAIVFDVPSSTYRLVSVPGDVIDPAVNTMYDPTRPGGLYVVDFNEPAFGGSRFTSAEFDGNNYIIFDALGGPVSDPLGETPSNGGTIEITGSNSNWRIQVEAFTGRVTATKLP